MSILVDKNTIAITQGLLEIKELFIPSKPLNTEQNLPVV